MKATKKRWRPSPFLVVFATATCVIAFMAFISQLSARRSRINARVEMRTHWLKRRRLNRKRSRRRLCCRMGKWNAPPRECGKSRRWWSG